MGFSPSQGPGGVGFAVVTWARAGVLMALLPFHEPWLPPNYARTLIWESARARAKQHTCTTRPHSNLVADQPNVVGGTVLGGLVGGDVVGGLVGGNWRARQHPRHLTSAGLVRRGHFQKINKKWLLVSRCCWHPCWFLPPHRGRRTTRTPRAATTKAAAQSRIWYRNGTPLTS